MSHMEMERKRRIQMHEHLKLLRSTTPSFYIKKGDQASIIAGVVEFIKELQDVLQALESKKRRKRVSAPPCTLLPHESSSAPARAERVQELSSCCNSSMADVEAKLSGAHVILNIISQRSLGQIIKIINLLENLSFEVVRLNISSIEEAVLCSLVVKIGLECQVSVEELALVVQQTFVISKQY